MQKNPSKSTREGFDPRDVLFVVFKRKWMISLLALAGFAAAAGLYCHQQPIYQSTARLLVRYVVESASVDPYAAMKSPGSAAHRHGDPVILTEIEILSSLDLAMEVAAEIGTRRLLNGAVAQSPGDETKLLSAAAGVIASELVVETGTSPNVLHITFNNPGREISRSVLEKLIELYFKKHLDIHRSAASFDLISKQAADVGVRLAGTEAELNELRTRSGILSLKDATESLAAQKNRTQQDLMTARAELAEQSTRIIALEAPGHGNPPEDDTAPTAAEHVPPQIITEFRAVMEMLAILQKRDLELRIKFKPGNPLLAQSQNQIATYDRKRISMLGTYPGLSDEKALINPANSNDAQHSLEQEKTRLAAIRAKIDVFEAHLREIGKLFAEQYAIGARIEELERRKQLEDAEFRSLEVKLKDARLDMTLDPSRIPNINIIQQPSEPVKTFDAQMRKIIFGLAGGGLALGLGLAFLIEMLFNRKVERPVEIQTRLQLPLLLSIPYFRRGGHSGMLLGNRGDTPRISDHQAGLPAISEDQDYEIAEEDDHNRPEHFILPYSETIRDRIVFNFEVNNVTHKPKLVAVTGMTEGAGTSTIAAGLAKSFAEIRGVKVLLVDLSSCHPQESPLFGEIPRHSLPNALRLARSPGFRERPQSLYYANAPARRDEPGASRFTPFQLHEMMPMLQASEYDYIIFDMPPVDQTSRTLAMAGLMDKVLLVLDARNTSRESLKWGYSELTRGRADVSCVFNKTRSHGPAWLLGDG